MSTAEKIHQISSNLAPSDLEELLDFAEFLRHRRGQPKTAGRPVPLSELAGGLENSKVLAESPLALQKKMRHEWD